MKKIRSRIKSTTFFITLSSLALILFVTSASVSAIIYGSGSYGTCQYSTCSISITSNGSVNLNVLPAIGGKCTIASDSVQVLTDDSNGYTLTLGNSTTTTALSNGANSIAATSGTFSSPTTLSANTWGYRVDGVGSYGSGPTTAQSNFSSSSLLFSAPPASNLSADTIENTSVPADPAVTTTIWYGVCADSTIPSGAYTGQILYTAIAN